MSENPFTDGQQFSAARLNSMYNAHQNEGVLNGLDASTSVNAFDVDVASGELFLNNTAVSVGSATVSLSTSDPEDRIDLISADSTGLTVTQGNPAATSGQPIAPDIPSGDVLVSLIYVRGGSTEILTGDIFNDYKTEVVESIPSGVITMWGGSIANIPNGWTLCDGSNGAPDLRDRFVVGAGAAYNAGETGGADSVQLSESEMPSHSHNVTIPRGGPGSFDNTRRLGLETADGGSETFTASTAGGNQPHENRPPFFALAYIQKL